MNRKKKLFVLSKEPINFLIKIKVVSSNPIEALGPFD